MKWMNNVEWFIYIAMIFDIMNSIGAHSTHPEDNS